jgi:hypothetical protein
MFLSSSLFIVQFFCDVGGSVCPGGYAGLSQEWLGNTTFYLVLTYWSADVSQASFEPMSGRALEPFFYFSVTWHGETLY